MTFHSGRGGKRKGAGRPKGSTMDPRFKRVILQGFRLPRWIVDWLNRQSGSGGKMIEKALVEYYGLTPPEHTK